MRFLPFCATPKHSITKRSLFWILLGSCCLLTLGKGAQQQPTQQHRQQMGHNGPIDVVDQLRCIVLKNTAVQFITQTWELVDQLGINLEFRLPSVQNAQQTIMNRMMQLTEQISTSENEIFSTAGTTVDTLIKQLAIETRLEAYLQELEDLINRISHRDELMRSYLESDEKLEQLTLEEFARSTVAQDTNSVPVLLARIELLVFGSRDRSFRNPGILRQLLKASEEAKSTVCSFELSAQQVIYHLYNAIAITELKSYSMMQFSWMLLKAYGKGNFTGEAKLMRRRFEDRTDRTQKLLKEVMAKASREYWRCDPEPNDHREGETYLQFTRLLQGYVVNEVDLNTQNTCKENCGYYGYGVMQEHCYDHRYCPRQTRCSGKIYDCEYIEADMWACLPLKSSPRRYEYIEYENGLVLGEKKQCPTTTVQSWWRWFYRCSYCFCMCDDAGPKSDRYINLRPSVSDIMNNKVVTGLRFVKRKRVIFLIVQQGTLLPGGQIDNATLKWVEPEAYDVLSKKFHNGRDYNTLKYDNRMIDLDDIVLQPSYVLTGVRFRMLGTHINLEARMTEINFGTGKLVNTDKSIWVGNDKTELSEDKRTELKLNRPHVPILSKTKSFPNSKPNQFIRFRATDRDRDASQTTVPFFDAQPVVPFKKTALGGCGLFHKAQPGFGGYVAPKLFTYDYEPHVQAPKQEGELPDTAAAMIGESSTPSQLEL